MYVTLVGGHSSLDGTSVEIFNPKNHMPLEFRVDDLHPVGFDGNEGLELYSNREIYVLEPIVGQNKTWWLAVHSSMNVDEALDIILGSYP